MIPLVNLVIWSSLLVGFGDTIDVFTHNNITMVDCRHKFSQFLNNKKGNNFATLPEACVTCGIQQASCHCSKLPSLCEDIKRFNDHYWTKCQARMVRAVLNFSFAIIGLLGNSLVVIVTWKFRNTLSRCHILIGGLATSDLIFSLSQTIRYVPTFWTCQWILGDLLCSGFPLIKDMSSYLAIGFILIIATERYMLICWPYRKPLSNVVVSCLLVLNIAIGVATTIPKVIKMRLNPYTGNCHAEWESKHLRITYDYVILGVYFLLPMLVMAYEHFRIVERLQSQDDIINRSKVDDKNLRRNKRITKILVTILAAYLLLVLPTRVVCIVRAHANNRIIQSDTLNTALRLFSCLPYGFHVAINPIIYSFIDKKFRKNIRAMFPCCFRKLDPKFDSSVTTSSL